MALAAGTRLGPYEIVAPLGAGGMGEVYRAQDTRLERTVAIKVLSSSLSQTAFTGAPVVSWSPDGRYLSYDAYSLSRAREENWILPLFGDRKPFQLASASANQYDGNFSPDGHWLAYFSYDSGRSEVYVVPFPGPGGKYQISTNGGWLVRWANKNHLFFMTTGNQLMDADLALGDKSLQIRSIHPLFQLPLLDTSAPLFDVTADGKRIIAVTPADPEANSIGLLMNWQSELKR